MKKFGFHVYILEKRSILLSKWIICYLFDKISLFKLLFYNFNQKYIIFLIKYFLKNILV